MSRAAVYDALLADTALTNLVPAQNILVNPNLDGRPSNLTPGAFLVVKWEEQAVEPVFFDGGARGPQVLTVWAHYPEEKSTDYVRLDNILEEVKKVVLSLEDTKGLDNRTVTSVGFSGVSGDLTDPAMKTICKTQSFRVLSHVTT